MTTGTTGEPTARTSATKSAAARKAADKPAAKKATPRKAASKKAATTKAPDRAAPKKKTTKTTTKTTEKAAKQTVTTRKSASGNGSSAVAPGSLVTLSSESPWTEAEVAEVREQLDADVTRLGADLAEAEGDLAGMMRGSEGAGHDQADVGSATFERDQEMTIVLNARDMLESAEAALRSIDEGTFGVCENCGNPIGKNRMMAFPRATMCLPCKQRQERR